MFYAEVLLGATATHLYCCCKFDLLYKRGAVFVKNIHQLAAINFQVETNNLYMRDTKPQENFTFIIVKPLLLRLSKMTNDLEKHRFGSVS